MKFFSHKFDFRTGNTFETNSKSTRNFLNSFAKNNHNTDDMDFNNNNPINNYNHNQHQPKLANMNMNNILNRSNNRASSSEVITNHGSSSRPILGLPSGLCASASNLSVASNHLKQPINQNFSIDSFKTPCNKILRPLNESTLKTIDSNINNRERVVSNQNDFAFKK